MLELKEELIKAEQELRTLKHDWAAHEAQKKRHDAKKVQKLRPLSLGMPSVSAGTEDSKGSSAWMQQEMERRKALINGTKTSNRTVFSPSRHARALSLIPTDSGATTAPSSPVKAQSDETAPNTHLHPHAQGQPPAGRPPFLSRNSTNGDMTQQVENADINIDLGIPREVLLKTGRQMASDFKDGLWTFIEDLRQATVGDEATNSTQQSRAQPSATAAMTSGGVTRKASKTSIRPGGATKSQPSSPRKPKPSKRVPSPAPAPAEADAEATDLIDVGGSFWKDNGLPEPTSSALPVVRKTSKSITRSPLRKTPHKILHAPTDSFDSWDTWDSPPVAPKPMTRSGSDTSVSETRSESGGGTSPRTSTRYVRHVLIPLPLAHRPCSSSRAASPVLHATPRLVCMYADPGTQFITRAITARTRAYPYTGPGSAADTARRHPVAET